jgi:uncharacterized membrane protein
MNEYFILTAVLPFANLLVASLTTGTMFGVCLSHNPAGLGPGLYVGQQQNAIRALNVKMPLLGGLTALLTLVSAACTGGHGARFSLLCGAALCFLASGLITRFLNQPINAVVMTWSPDAPPANWTQLRDEWWRWHVLRTIAAIAGLSSLIATALQHTSAS